ncbi:MAG: right-handed parallel beta-helix repeat-containing protein, partial [Candidatus Latescibacteria bacterium]|nr:right-handed parallel beta-helix repeat-containing protein [Candidatus Latescibacterota bacterium]
MEAKVWRLLVATGIIACLVVAEARANPDVAYAIPVSNLTIDGHLEDWPREMVWVSIDRVLESSYFESIAGAGPLLQPGDFSGRFTAGYDSTENTVFVAIEVEDQTDLVDEAHQGTTVVGNTDWSLWDGCEVYLDLTHGKQPGRIQQLALYGGKQNLSFQGKKTKVARSRVGNLTTYEWSIDASSKKPAQMLSAGMAVGFDIAICDRDGDGSFSWISWTPGSSKLASLERVGTLRLLERRAEFSNLNIQVGIQDHRGKYLDNLAPYGSLVGVRLMAGSQIAGAESADSLGNCRFRLPEGRYSVHAWAPGVGDTIHVADIAINDTTAQSFAVLLKDRGAAFFVDAAADSNGTGTPIAPFSRLGQAVTASGPGDTIYAAAGKYPEGIELHWGVHLIGAGPEKTVLQGKEAKISFREARGGTIQGVAITEGRGIGLFSCRQFLVQSNILNGNRAEVGAGILLVEGRDLTISQNLVAQNQSEVGGGGIAIVNGDSTVEISGNLIVANSAAPSTPEGKQQANGIGGGILVQGGNPVIRNNSIIYNRAARRGGGITITGVLNPTHPEIANNIVAHNDHGGVFSWYQGVPNLHHNNVWNNSEWDYLGCEPGPKSFSEDPQFIDPLGGDFGLNRRSPSNKKGDAPEHHLGASGEVVSWSLKTIYLPTPDTLRLWVGPKKQNPPPLEKYHIVPIAERDKSLVIDRGLPREQVALDSLETIPLNRDFTTYTTKDGLASNMVLDVELARDGVLWFSTNQGLSRFDGTWRTFTPKDGLAAPMVQDLCVDQQRRVWCATKDGLSVYDGKEWVTYLEGQNVTSVAVDSAGVVWGTTVGEFFRYDDRTWEFYLVAPFMIPGFPFGISLIDSHNRIYVGALRYDNDQWAAYSATGTDGLEMPVGMTEDRDGQIWYANLQVSGGQYRSQISRFDGKGWVNYVLPSSLTGYMATMPVEDLQGNIWVTASRGLLRFDGKTWCRILDWDKMPPCTDAVSTPDGSLWIGTNGGGVVRIGKPSWAGL